MKTVLLVILAVALIATPVFADTTTKADYSVPSSQAFENFLNTQEHLTHNHGYNMENYVEKDDYVLGVKADAPNLVIITDNVSVGVEASKNFVQTSLKEGVEAYVKVTYKGSLFDFRK